MTDTLKEASTMEQQDKADRKQPEIVDLSQLSHRELEIIFAILRFALSKMSLDDLLRQALALVLSSPEFMLKPKGCIFLADHKGRFLSMVAQQQLPETVQQSCNKLSMGRCVCGQAAETGKIVYTNQIDSHHEIHHSDDKPHGHYCVPIKSNGELLGVFNFYVTEGHQRSEREERFLKAVADTLSGLIMHRRAEEALILAHDELEQQVEQRSRELQNEVMERQRAEAELRDTAEVISITAAEEHALGVLLQMSLKPLEIEEYLQQALETLLLSIPWLTLLPKGGIFLTGTKGEKKTLRLVANHKLAPELLTLCARVPFGHCLCGRAAAEQQVQYSSSCTDPRHEVQFPDMQPHGHYTMPILLGESVLGVLVLYLPDGHERKPSDEAFLQRVADVLSMGITRRRVEAKIEYLRDHDSLTGLPNRNLLLSGLEGVVAQNEHNRHMGAVLFIGLDNFKQINNSLGRSVGDLLLQKMAHRLTALLRKEDSLSRVGGDEFIVLLPEEGNDAETVIRQAQRVSEKIRQSVARSFQIDGHELNVASSIGIALFPVNDITASEILQQADTAMHRAKEEGGNITRFFLPAMQKLVDQRFAIERDLRCALEKQKLQLYFQPQVDAQGRLVGAEALLRCPDSNGDMVRMDLCIPVAESTGLILPIGEWVLCEACAMLEAWTDKGIAAPIRHLCINISPKQFYQQDFVSLVKSILAEYAVDPRRLVFEITESLLIDSTQEAIETMQALKAMGIGLAIDDFGTGYSSLSYLTQLPLDILKIDRSFVTGVADDPKRAVVVETLVAMASKLGFEIIAEGVETKEELEFLLAKGCTCFQGYYYSPPKPAKAFTNDLSNPCIST